MNPHEEKYRQHDQAVNRGIHKEVSPDDIMKVKLSGDEKRKDERPGEDKQVQEQNCPARNGFESKYKFFHVN